MNTKNEEPSFSSDLRNQRPALIPLWPGTPPEALGDDPERDIPTLTVYLPEPSQANGAAVIVCPGGGYWELMDYEGRDFALWLCDRGITAFVLKYRLGSAGYRHPAITNDMKRAVRHVRAHAERWNLDRGRIGVIGSSAGGHLASYVAVHHDPGNPAAEDLVERASCRPDYAIFCYAIFDLELQACGNLTGSNPSAELLEHLSTCRHVTAETPPCFIWQTQRDRTVPVEHAFRMARALRDHDVLFSLHVYPEESHGSGLGVNQYQRGDTRETHPWALELDRWLKAILARPR